MVSILALVGNPQAHSRTRLIAEDLARSLADQLGGHVEDTIDLADVADELFRFPSARVDHLLVRAADADLVIVASPTYKASYTGLLKAFLDRYPANGLADVVAIPLMTVASDAHALAVEHTLRPLLVELGASLPTRGISFPVAEIDTRVDVHAKWVENEHRHLSRAIGRH